jgi:hypothetical protein
MGRGFFIRGRHFIRGPDRPDEKLEARSPVSDAADKPGGVALRGVGSLVEPIRRGRARLPYAAPASRFTREEMRMSVRSLLTTAAALMSAAAAAGCMSDPSRPITVLAPTDSFRADAERADATLAELWPTPPTQQAYVDGVAETLGLPMVAR